MPRARRAHRARSTAASTLDGPGTFRARPARARPSGAERAGGARGRPARRPRLRAARRTPTTVAVVGAGMAAATEWLNALAAGARVTSVRRREPVRRPLNVPRPLFSRRGLAAFHALAPGRARRASCGRCSRPRIRPGALGRAARARAARGRFRVAVELNGAAQVICATGFQRGFRHDPLLARLVDEHGLETADGWLVLAADCTVPALTDGDADARGRGRRGAVGVPGRRHAGRREVRRARLPAQGEGMSYTLRGRIDSRARGARCRCSSRCVARARAAHAGGRSSSPR